MPRTLDPDNVSFVILDLGRLLRAAFEQAITESTLDLTPAEARVLAHLARHAPARPGHLAEMLGMSAMSVTGFVDRLEASGYVQRRPDPQDGRAKMIDLTDKADSALMEMKAIGEKIRRRARGSIPADQWDLFRTLAVTARNNLSGANRDDT